MQMIACHVMFTTLCRTACTRLGYPRFRTSQMPSCAWVLPAPVPSVFIHNAIPLLLTYIIYRPDTVHFALFNFYRMANLDEPMDLRKAHLEDSLRLQQFYRSVEEEQQWVRECRPQAASTDYGKTMSQVEKLQKKHQVNGGRE